jgi:hypothetical protein
MIKNNQIRPAPPPEKFKGRAAEGDDEPLMLDETDPNYLDISQK